MWMTNTNSLFRNKLYCPIFTILPFLSLLYHVLPGSSFLSYVWSCVRHSLYGDGISSKPAIFIKTGLRKVVPTNEIIVGGFKILYVELNPVFFWHLIVSHSGANSNTISAEITTTVGHPEAEVWNKYGFSLRMVI